MTDDTKDRKGKPGAGGSGGKDLDELKARLGLKKPGKPAAATRKPKSSEDDFKFSFGEDKVTEQFSKAELAAIDAEGRKATSPLGRRIMMVVVAMAVGVVLIWLGFQFGSSMGLRVLHNASVSQAQEIKEFFTKTFTDRSGRELKSRKDASGKLADEIDRYVEEHFQDLHTLNQILSKGALPPDFDYPKFVTEHLEPLEQVCKDFLLNVEEYNLAVIMRGQLYSTELGAKLLEFSNRANILRSKVEALHIAIQILQGYRLSGESPKNLKPKLLLYAQKAQKDKDKTSAAVPVAVAGTPEVDRELINKELCEPIAIELEIPICGAKRNDPQTEKRLIDTFEKKEAQEVIPYRKVKVKNEADGKSLTAKIEHLYELDLVPYLKPLLERIAMERGSNAENLGVVFVAYLETLNDVKEVAGIVDYASVLEVIEKYADQETLYTF